VSRKSFFKFLLLSVICFQIIAPTLSLHFTHKNHKHTYTKLTQVVSDHDHSHILNIADKHRSHFPPVNQRLKALLWCCVVLTSFFVGYLKLCADFPPGYCRFLRVKNTPKYPKYLLFGQLTI